MPLVVTSTQNSYIYYPLPIIFQTEIFLVIVIRYVQSLHCENSNNDMNIYILIEQKYPYKCTYYYCRLSFKLYY